MLNETELNDAILALRDTTNKYERDKLETKIFENVRRAVKFELSRWSKSKLVNFEMDTIEAKAISQTMMNLSSYNPTKAVNSSKPAHNFIALLVKRSIGTSYKSVKSQKRKMQIMTTGGGHSPDGDDLAYADFAVAIPSIEQVEESETVALILDELKPSLSDLEYQTLLFYLQGFTYAEIGVKTETSLKAVDNAMSRIKDKACGMEALENMYFKYYRQLPNRQTKEKRNGQ